MNDEDLDLLIKQNDGYKEGVFKLDDKNLRKLLRDAFHAGILAEYNAAKVRGDEL